jgi:hypothetical protein
MPLTVQQMTQQSQKLLDDAFAKVYADIYQIKYHLKYSYGKYKIYKSEYDDNLRRRSTTTLASGLDKVTAEGMMKLLEEPK